jgi:hypothetical protein
LENYIFKNYLSINKRKLKNQIRNIIKEQFKQIFEGTSDTYGYGGGYVESEDTYYDFGFDSFQKQPEEIRFEIANNQFNELKKQFNGDENKAIENMPDYLIMYI